MSSETTKKQLAGVEAKIELWGRAADETQELVLWFQAKLALVQTLEIQERMERDEKKVMAVCKPCAGSGIIEARDPKDRPSQCWDCQGTGYRQKDGSAGGGE